MHSIKTLGTRAMKRACIGTAMLCSLHMPAEPHKAIVEKSEKSAHGTIGNIGLTWLRIFRDPFPNGQVEYSVKKKEQLTGP